MKAIGYDTPANLGTAKPLSETALPDAQTPWWEQPAARRNWEFSEGGKPAGTFEEFQQRAREYDAAAKAYPEPAYDPAQGRPGIWDPRTQTYSPFPDPGPFNPWEGYMSGGIAGSGALPGGQEFGNATTPTTPTAPTTPTPAPAWYKPESDPSGSMWDAFQKSLNQATMPAQFRATWGGG